MSNNNFGLEELHGVVIRSYKEQKEFIALIKNYGIKLLYPELEKDKKWHALWGIDNNSAALIGTVIIRHLPKEKIFHGVEELSNYLKSKI